MHARSDDKLLQGDIRRRRSMLWLAAAGDAVTHNSHFQWSAMQVNQFACDSAAFVEQPSANREPRSCIRKLAVYVPGLEVVHRESLMLALTLHSSLAQSQPSAAV
jgi:hypothetical protein